MERNEHADSRNGLVRVLLAVGLAVVAVASLRKRKRSVALLSGIGAVALGYTATDGSGGSDAVGETRHIETTSERGEMRCAICGEPIVTGQGRGPNEDHETVHDSCLQ